MAKFSQNTLNQVAGFDGQILAENLVYNQKDFWNFEWAAIQSYAGGWVANTTPTNLTGATIDAQIIRRAIEDYHDSRTGLDFIIKDYPAVPLVTQVTATTTGTNIMTATTTADMFIGQAIEFTGTVFGGVAINTTYYVKEIITSTTFTISASRGAAPTYTVGPVFALSTASGTMNMVRAKPSPINLSITNRDDTNGTFTMVIDDAAWAVIMGDPDLDINATEPACFTGRVKISFPVVGSQPEYDEFVFLLFLINSDGVVN